MTFTKSASTPTLPVTVRHRAAVEYYI